MGNNSKWEIEWRNFIETSKEYKRIESELKASGFTDNKREEIAKRLGLSVQQADRYKSFSNLIPDVQNLIRDYGSGMSSLLKIGTFSPNEQKNIADILIKASEEGYILTRKFIDHVMSLYNSDIKCWELMAPLCSDFKKEKKTAVRSNKKNEEFIKSNLNRLSGTDFEKYVAELLKENGFTSVSITQHSYDGGRDIVAQKDGLSYIFQCKKKKMEDGKMKTVRINALQEIFYAKGQSDHVAVVVTNSRFAKPTIKSANERGILCWDWKVLKKMKENALKNNINKNGELA